MDVQKISKDRQEQFTEVIRSLVHEIHNNLHLIRMEVELLTPEMVAQGSHTEALFKPIASINNLLRDLGDLPDYFALSESKLCEENPDQILEEVAVGVKNLSQKRVHLQLVRKNPLPTLRVNSGQLRKVFERVMEFSQALVGDAGDLEIEAGLKKIDGQEYIELKIASSSANLLEVEEEDVFQPFLRIKGHQIGLGMALAHEILRRDQGLISFRKENSKRGQVTVLIRVQSVHKEPEESKTLVK
jgi:nitrogen-specific signal transduction histidine kinase